MRSVRVRIIALRVRIRSVRVRVAALRVRVNAVSVRITAVRVRGKHLAGPDPRSTATRTAGAFCRRFRIPSLTVRTTSQELRDVDDRQV